MPESVTDILNEYIFENKFILVENNIMTKNRIKNLLSNTTKIVDIMNTNGRFLTQNQINKKYNINLDHLSYNTILSAIPQEWKSKIKNCCHNLQKCNNNININIPHLLMQSKPKNILELQSRNISTELLSHKIKPLTVIDTWLDIYPFLHDMDWSLVFKLPYKIVREPYLQTFQYKVINRLINCNHNLHKWKIKDSPNCNDCSIATDTVEHHLYSCPKTQMFWSRISKWIENVLEVKFQFTVCEILFGLLDYDTKDYVIKAINFVLLLGKWFINKCKTKNTDTHIFEFQTRVKSKLQALHYIFQNQDNEEEFQKIFGLFID